MALNSRNRQEQRLITTFFFFFLCFCPSFLGADSGIYKWVDEKGVTHYSSKKPKGVKSAKTAKLPKITKVSMKVPVISTSSCRDHGGIDCQAGSDEDGSVICRDGFKGSLVRYKFACSSPKLIVSSFSSADFKDGGGFTVTVRNKKGVKAEGVSVYYLHKGGKVSLTGPKEINPYGAGRYTFDPKKRKQPFNFVEKPKIGDIKITCLNCS